MLIARGRSAMSAQISGCSEPLSEAAVGCRLWKDLAMDKKAINVMGCAAALCILSAAGVQAQDGYAPNYEKSPGYYRAGFLPSDMGEAGYYGGSSGGIPGTGVPAYERGYDRYSPGIPPEDRPYPVWNGPERLLR
jgi:hypothetical protein